MSQPDPIVIRELPVIQKIIADETWLEGERRGRYVSSDDPVVRRHVCEVILCIGEKLRTMFQQEQDVQPCPIVVTDRSTGA